MPEGERRPSLSDAAKFTSGILPQKYPRLHDSPEVSFTVAAARLRGERVTNDPERKISVYLDSLLGKHGLLGGGGVRQERQIAKHVIKADEIPEAYFENQQLIAREQGHRDVNLTQEMREQLADTVITDQKESLKKWVKYVNSSDPDYPAWFRYDTIRSILTLGAYDKRKHKFTKRSRGTTAPFIELNREALAYVYDQLNGELGEKSIEEHDDAKLKQLLKAKNFGKLYAHALQEAHPISQELRETTAGEWVKYDESDRREDAQRLSRSLQGHNTGWCTAGEATAGDQLQKGDLYVYYSYDEEEKPTVPRVAIRMRNGKVSEVRGINSDQNLEGNMVDITEGKLADLPGGAEYHQKLADMKEVTRIEKMAIAGEELTLDELRFLYEIDRRIIGFGYTRDPRLMEIISKRDLQEDGALIFDCRRDQIALGESELTSDTRALFGDLKYYEEELPNKLEYIRGDVELSDSRATSLGNLHHIDGSLTLSGSSIKDLGDLERIDGFADFEDSELPSLGRLLSIGEAAFFGNTEITNLGKLALIGEDADFGNSKIKSLGQLKEIGGSLIINGSQLEDLGELRRIGGEVNFEYSKIEDLGQLEYIGESAYFSGSKIKSLGVLRTIGGIAHFRLSEVDDLEQLQSIGGNVYLDKEASFDLSHVKVGGKFYF